MWQSSFIAARVVAAVLPMLNFEIVCSIAFDAHLCVLRGIDAAFDSVFDNKLRLIVLEIQKCESRMRDAVIEPLVAISVLCRSTEREAA